jgi:hypothetical protein
MVEMRLSCSVWAMRGPMPLTNCKDVSRVSSTSEMLSAAPAAAPDVGYLAGLSRAVGEIRDTTACNPPVFSLRGREP